VTSSAPLQLLAAGAVDLCEPLAMPRSARRHVLVSAHWCTTVRGLADQPDPRPTCWASVEKPMGFYDAQDGTLRISSFGYIQCAYGTNGYVPRLHVFVQLHGWGPYQFYSHGTGSNCSGMLCGVQDVRYFNLNCGQHGYYSHGARLTGSWTDGVSTHPVEMEAPVNSGAYYHRC
jgi:hypothetical protein